MRRISEFAMVAARGTFGNARHPKLTIIPAAYVEFRVRVRVRVRVRISVRVKVLGLLVGLGFASQIPCNRNDKNAKNKSEEKK